jgi:hypothetical protein
MQEPMIRIQAKALQAFNPITLGPAPFFRVHGAVLLQGPHNDVVGRYSQHHWEVAGRYYSSYECTDRTWVHFQDREGRSSEALGPFERLHFPNGSCYADDQQIAQFMTESERWRDAGTGARWSGILISPSA